MIKNIFSTLKKRAREPNVEI